MAVHAGLMVEIAPAMVRPGRWQAARKANFREEHDLARKWKEDLEYSQSKSTFSD